jgi:hypothetical protein
MLGPRGARALSVPNCAADFGSNFLVEFELHRQWRSEAHNGGSQRAYLSRLATVYYKPHK